MIKTIRIDFTEEQAQRVERWAIAQHLKPTTATKKLLLDHIAEWERNTDANND